MIYALLVILKKSTLLNPAHCRKKKFSIKDFFMQKSLMENILFCAVVGKRLQHTPAEFKLASPYLLLHQRNL